MLNRVKLEDVPEVYRDLVDVIGLEAFKNLVRYMGGSILYVPVEAKVTMRARNRIVREAFRGDYKSLAAAYNLSEVHVRRIIRNRG